MRFGVNKSDVRWRDTDSEYLSLEIAALFEQAHRTSPTRVDQELVYVHNPVLHVCHGEDGSAGLPRPKIYMFEHEPRHKTICGHPRRFTPEQACAMATSVTALASGPELRLAQAAACKGRRTLCPCPLAFVGGKKWRSGPH